MTSTVLNINQLDTLLVGVMSSKRVFLSHFASDLFNVMYSHGFRVSEVLELERWSMYSDFQLICDTAKGSNNRIIDRAELPSLFVASVQAERFLYNTFSYSKLEQLFQMSFKGRYIKVQSKRIGTHLFRHNYIKHLNENGLQLADIKARTGIVSDAVVLNYVYSSPTLYHYS